MSPKARTLLIITLVLSAWIVGFLMGGWFRGQPEGSAKADAMAAGERAAAERAAATAAKRVGSVEDADSESVRRQPWDRARLVAAGRSLRREGSVATILRRAIQISDQLGPDDFPGVMDGGADGSADKEMADMIELFATARWAELDPKAAVEYMVKNKKFGGWFDFDGMLLWSIWGSKDPNGAVAFAKGMEDASARKDGLQVIVESLARMDPDNAIAFARVHAPELVKDGSLSSALNENKDPSQPEENARRLVSFHDPEDSTSGIEQAASAWATQNRGAALQWAQALADPKVRAAALAGVYREWLPAAPKEAAAAFLAEARNGEVLDGIAFGGANEWPLDDWAGAAAWAGKLPSEKERSAAYSALAVRLGKDNSKAGADWLQSLPPTSEKDAAISAYATEVAGEDAAGAMEWTFTISDPARRKEAGWFVVKHWFERNPSEAISWFQKTDSLTPAQKQELLK